MVLKMPADNQDNGQDMENPSTYRGLPGNPAVRGQLAELATWS